MREEWDPRLNRFRCMQLDVIKLVEEYLQDLWEERMHQENPNVDDNAFWLVIDNRMIVVSVHNSYKQAVTYAESIASASPGRKYYIAHAAWAVQAQGVTVTQLKSNVKE